MKNALEATAQEMGAVLKPTSFSPNIKERMDASCSIFDANAQLVAQAERAPVHPSMLRAVQPTIAAVGHLDEGDVIVANDPFRAAVIARHHADRRYLRRGQARRLA